MSPRLVAWTTAMLVLATAAAAQPVVRVKVATPPPLLVGQPIRIDVQVLVPNFFLGPPKLPILDVPGAVVTLTDDAVNLNETIRGRPYAGIQRTYLLVASGAGRLSLPAAPVEVTYAATPGQPAVSSSVAMPAAVLDIGWPAGMAPADVPAGMLVARVVVRQQLDRDPASLTAGDALTRRVETTAAETQSMLIPPPAFDAPAEVKVYARDPVLSDERASRGGLVAGHRTDTAVYVFPHAGTYTLPAIDVPWFDRATQRPQTATAPAITVTVGPGAAEATGIAPEPDPAAVPAPPPAPRRWRPSRGAVVAGALLLLAAWWLSRTLPRWRASYRAFRARTARSEPALFGRFDRACRDGDQSRAYDALLIWMRSLGIGSTGSAAGGDDAAFAVERRGLEERLYSTRPASAAWDGRALAAAAARLRHRRRVVSLPPDGARHLPALNPS